MSEAFWFITGGSHLSFVILRLAQGQVGDDAADVSQRVLRLLQPLPTDQPHQRAVKGRPLGRQDVLLPRAQAPPLELDFEL